MERTKRLDLVILSTTAAFVLLLGLGTGSLSSWDEAVYAQVSREILTGGNWIDLTWLGQPWADKPPLYMWVTAFFYTLFGISEFSVRLFSALCGIGTVITTYLFACKLYSRKAAFIAALLLLSTAHFIWASKNGMLDGALTFFIILSLYLFVVGEEKPRYLFFSVLAFVAAFLTKGTGALLIPITLVSYLLLTKKFGILKRRSAILGFLVALIILGAWHVVAIAHYGDKFIAEFFIKHLLARTTHAIEGHTGGIFTYFKAIPNKGRPWGAIGLIMASVAAYRFFTKKETQHLVPLLLVVSVLVVFSITKTKLHWYIIPIYPALAMLSGFMCEKIFKNKSVIIISLLFLAAFFYLTFERKVFNLDYTPETKKLALRMRATITGDDKLILYDVTDPAMQFYCGGFSKKIFPSATAAFALDHTHAYILVNRDTSLSVFPHGHILAENPTFIFIETIPVDN